MRKVQVTWPIVRVEELQHGLYIEETDNAKICYPKLVVHRVEDPIIYIFFDPQLYKMLFSIEERAEENRSGKGKREIYAKPELDLNYGLVTLKRGLAVAIAHISLNPNIRHIVCIGASVRALQRLLYDAWKRGSYDIISEKLARLNDYLRKQILSVIVLDNFSDSEPDWTAVTVGSQYLYVPKSNVYVDSDRRLVEITLPLPRAALPHVLMLLYAVAIQEEPWRLVIKTALGDVVDEYVLYDPGAAELLPEDLAEYARSIVLALRPSAIQQKADEIAKRVLKAAATGNIAKAVAETLAAVTASAENEVDILLRPRKVVTTDTVTYYDHGYLKIVIADDFFDAYRLLVKEISETGLPVKTRFGWTRETVTLVVYRRFPRLELEIMPAKRLRRADQGFMLTREREHVLVKFIEMPPDDVMTLSDLEPEELKSYIEDLLSGRIDFDAEYNYGMRMRFAGNELPQTYYRRGKQIVEISATEGQKQVAQMLVKFYESVDRVDDQELRKVLLQTLALVEVDQLNEIVETLRRDETARYALICMWNSLVDTTRLVPDQPCWVLIQFMIRRLGGRNRLLVLSYCRSHDFQGAHIANAYGVLFGTATYIVQKLRQIEERFKDLEPGPGIALIASNHVYV